MKTLMGYSDVISVPQGGTIAFKVSSEDGASYRAQMVRLINGDTNPAGPGYREEEVLNAHFDLPGRKQLVRPGSCVVISNTQALRDLTSFSVSLVIWPTTPAKQEQVLVSLWDMPRQAGFILALSGRDGLVLQLGDGTGNFTSVKLGCAIFERHWYRMSASFDTVGGLVHLRQDALSGGNGLIDAGEVSHAVAITSLGSPTTPLLFAARGGRDGREFEAFFNGKIEAPSLRGLCDIPIGSWDLSIGITGADVHDVSGNDLHGKAVHMPTRGMTGHNWDGGETNWKHCPSQYGAIHFHDDDLADAGWQTDFTWQVPHDTQSGLYAARLSSATDEDYIPFVIRASLKSDNVKVLVIIPTASYQAYANEHLALDAALAETVHDHLPVFGPNDLYLAEHRELGGSLYDRHSDGSGISTSSRLRPILNMRPKYQSWLGGTGSALWQLAADTHLLAWLEHSGIPFDCIADEDLDAQGVSALSPYLCIMTGTHAEYWSTVMRDALDGYRNHGGRIMHMGANGLYWRIAYDPAGTGSIEVRRCEVGNGWVTAPGEAYHAFNGEYGGLWRRLGRPPQQSVGVGFVGQGFDKSSYYRRLPDSMNFRAAFIFDGVKEEIIGDFGLIGGGAAGLELDRTDISLGTPLNTLILACSEGHTPTYLPTVEALLINYVNQAAISPVYAEMIFYETPSGGAVFSTGSIAWAGSLSHNGYNNNICHISFNVITRFIDPTPFEFPAYHQDKETT